MADDVITIECLTEGELDDPVTEDELLEQAGRLMDKSYTHEILGEVVYLTEDGRWKVATVETHLGDAHPRYLRDRLEEFLAEAGADHPMYERAQEKLEQLKEGADSEQ